MSEAKESALYLHNLLEQEAEAQQRAAENEKIQHEEFMQKHDSLVYDRIRLREAYNDYKIGVKNVCLQYVIEEMMSTAMKKSLNEMDQNMLHGLVENYVNTKGGASAILSRCIGKTYLLDTIKEEVEETSEEIIAKADEKDPSTFVVDKEDITKLLNKLRSNDDFEDVKSAIAIRVVGAEDSFVDNCKAEKEKMNDILLKAEEKCKAADEDEKMSDEVKDQVKQEAQRECKRALNALNEAAKPAIFDEMVRRFTLSSVRLNRKNYILESGKVDTERVINTVSTMYTLIETLSTSKLENVDEAFISETLAEL